MLLINSFAPWDPRFASRIPKPREISGRTLGFGDGIRRCSVWIVPARGGGRIIFDCWRALLLRLNSPVWVVVFNLLVVYGTTPAVAKATSRAVVEWVVLDPTISTTQQGYEVLKNWYIFISIQFDFVGRNQIFFESLNPLAQIQGESYVRGVYLEIRNHKVCENQI